LRGERSRNNSNQTTVQQPWCPFKPGSLNQFGEVNLINSVETACWRCRLRDFRVRRSSARAPTGGDNFFELQHQPVLKAVCGRNKEDAESFAKTWGYESVETDWRKLLERTTSIRSTSVCLADFIEGLDKNEPAEPTFRQALETTRICEAMLASARDGSWKHIGA
jgi:hypothetical protein